MVTLYTTNRKIPTPIHKCKCRPVMMCLRCTEPAQFCGLEIKNSKNGKVI